MRVDLIDYGCGNLRSVAKALEAAGAAPCLVAGPRQLSKDAPIVLPGVGAFGDAMARLAEAGLVDTLTQEIRSGRPYLGICLGLQILFESSDEKGEHRGLGIFPGRVVRFQSRPGFKVPHMGWNRLTMVHPHPLLAGLPPLPYVYFVHSYFPRPAERSLVLATTDHGEEFACAVGRGKVVGVQFHPEKSQAIGGMILARFLAMAGSQGERASCLDAAGAGRGGEEERA